MDKKKQVEVNKMSDKSKPDKAIEVEIKEQESKIKVNKNKVLAIAGIVVILIGLVISFTLSAGNSAQGVWELYSIEQGGNIIAGEDLEVQYGGKVLYNLNSDGSLVVTQLGQEIVGTWSEEENTVFFHYSSSIKELQRDEDTMILEQNGGVYTFVR